MAADTDDYSTRTETMEGNAAGWAGVRINPEESDPSDLRVRDARDPFDEDVAVNDLRPYETATLVLEAADDRREIRVVADDYGTIRLSVPGHYVTDDYDPTLFVQVGDGGEITIDAHHVSDVDRYED